MEAARRARTDDLPRLVALAEAARAELGVMRGGPMWLATDARPDPLEDGLRADLDHPECLVLAGTIDEVVVGYAVARVETLGDGRRLGVVTDLFVEEEARGIGLGEALMDDVLAWCGEQGCAGVDARALPGHRAAKNFFERSGFTARQLVMHRSL